MSHLLLIGYRGTGKSVVGQLLAAHLGRPFVDADTIIEELAGKMIARIFAEDGEPVFRELESRILAELVQRDPLVLATGGGVVLRPENRALLKAAGYVAWLDAPPEVVWPRIQADATTSDRRPPLGAGGFEEVVALMNARRQLYEAAASARFDASASPEAVAAAIIAAWTG